MSEARTGVALVEREGAAPARGSDVSILDVIRRAASDPTIDVEKMERLMAMHERLLARQAEAEFDAAMVAAQGEMRAIREDKDNSQTKSKYASYEALDRVARPIYVRHGFAVSFGQGEGAPDSYVRVVADVSHKAGHRRAYHADMPADGKGAKGGDVMTKTHATGSAFSYGRRYLLALIFNLVIGGMQDDDGNAASAVFVTAEQKAEIVALMKKCDPEDADPGFTGRFLKHLGARSVDELPATKFAAAITALNNKLAQRAKA